MKAKKPSPKKTRNLGLRINETSIVLIIAVIITAIIINQKNNQPMDEAGRIIKVILDENSAKLHHSSVIDQAELETIQGMTYDQLKKYLNVKNDFCLYVEDGNGNIILAKGSAKLSIDKIYCKE